MHLRYLLSGLGFRNLVIKPTVIFNDNQSSHFLIKNEGNHSKTKHIRVRNHFIRRAVNRNKVEVLYKQTEEMLADVLTKGLSYNKHKYCIENLGIN